MKRIIRIVFLILLPLFLFAQSNVDVVVKRLEKLSMASFDEWKMSTKFGDVKEDIKRFSNPDFDDSDWETLRIGQRVYIDSCWLRKKIVLPSYIAGMAVRGRIRLLLTVDDYGYLWVNGKSRGRFPWNGEFILTEDGRPGTKYVILIRAVNTGGPLRILRAQAESETSIEMQQRIDKLALSLRVGQKLLSFDTYQTNSRVKTDPHIDKSKMDRAEKQHLNELLQEEVKKIDTAALDNGNLKKFWGSVDRVLSKLKPVRKFVKRFTLFFDANAHIDAAWLWRSKETVEVCNRTFSSVINMMNQRPDFTYTQSQAVMYRWMENLYPELFEKIRLWNRKGRWEIVGGMWVEPDCNLPSGESWYRQLLYGQSYFKKKFGKKALIGWNPDSFGYNWNLPQFFKNSGIDIFVTQKIGWNDTTVFPYRVFWWEAPDGSRVLTYFPFNYVDTIENPYRLVDWLRQFEANTGFTKLMILFGVGDHGGGPSLEMLERIDRLNSLYIFPNIEFGTAQDYLFWLRRQNLSNLPVWKDELYLEYHRGTYTTQARTKTNNRKSEVLLTNAEKFKTIASIFSPDKPSQDLKEAWKTVLFNQFHDILPGSSIREVYVDAERDYKEVFETGEYELKKSLRKIAKNINTSSLPQGIPVVVFNPLSWERTDVASVSLRRGDCGDYNVYDEKGNKVVSQIVKKSKYSRELIFIAENVPSLGYRVFVLRKNRNKNSDLNPNLSASENMIENEFFRITIDKDSGWITTIFDKRSEREVLKGEGNRLQLFEDRPSAWDAWNIGLGKEYQTKFRKIELLESGPVRCAVRIHRDFLKPGVKKSFPTEDFPTSFFKQDVILYSGIDRIDFRTIVEWWENKTMAKTSFSVNVHDTVATYEIPYGFIHRSTTLKRPLDRGKWEVPVLRWADLSDGEYGVSLLNNSKYGYDIKGNVMRISLLRSPQWPDPTADRGNHTILYSLYPHSGTWRDAETVHRGYELNYPLISVLTEPHNGTLPTSHSFIQIAPSNLILTAVKKSEDSKGWIFQWYDAEARDVVATITLPMKPKRVFLSNFLEEELKPVKFEGKTIKINTNRSEVKTLKVIF